MPPAGRGLAPCTPFVKNAAPPISAQTHRARLFNNHQASINSIPVLQETPAPPQAGRRGSGKSWRLSDRARNRLLPGRFAFRARKTDQNSRPGSITRPAREFRQTLPEPRRHAPFAPGTKFPNQTASSRSFSTLRQTTRTASINSIPFPQRTPAQPQAGRRDSGKGCRLSDRARNRLLPGRLTFRARKTDQNSRPGSSTRPAREFRQTLPEPRRHAHFAPRTISPNRLKQIILNSSANHSHSLNQLDPNSSKNSRTASSGSAGFGQGLAAV